MCPLSSEKINPKLSLPANQHYVQLEHTIFEKIVKLLSYSLKREQIVRVIEKLNTFYGVNE